MEVTGSHTQDGWVVDKGDITSVIDDWDHRFLIENDDPLIDAFEQSGDGDSLVVLEHPPTAEVMELVLERKLLETLPESVSDISVAVRETSEICAGATHLLGVSGLPTGVLRGVPAGRRRRHETGDGDQRRSGVRRVVEDRHRRTRSRTRHPL